MKFYNKVNLVILNHYFVQNISLVADLTKSYVKRCTSVSIEHTFLNYVWNFDFRKILKDKSFTCFIIRNTDFCENYKFD